MKVRISRLVIAGLALGSGLLLGNYLYSAYLIPSQKPVLPDLSKKFQKPSDWGKYSNFNQALNNLAAGWNRKGSSKLEDQIEVNGAVPDTLRDQVLRIQAIFDDEVRFRRESLNKNLLGFQTRLNREMSQKLEEETTSLNILTAKKIAEKEKELKASFEKYRLELRALYQKRLVDLNLQVSVGAIPMNDFSKTQGLTESQAEINRIHEEFNSKLLARQQKLADELASYSKQLHEANKITLTQLRARLSETIQTEINNFQNTQENNYLGWYQKRAQEISQAIELREKNSLELPE